MACVVCLLGFVGYCCVTCVGWRFYCSVLLGGVLCCVMLWVVSCVLCEVCSWCVVRCVFVACCRLYFVCGCSLFVVVRRLLCVVRYMLSRRALFLVRCSGFVD